MSLTEIMERAQAAHARWIRIQRERDWQRRKINADQLEIGFEPGPPSPSKPPKLKGN